MQKALFENRKCLIYLMLLLATACGGTGKYVESDSMTVTSANNTQSISTESAVNLLFNKKNYTIELCEADAENKICIEGETPEASGVGGLFLPLIMNLESITVHEANAEGSNELRIKTTLDAPVNRIPSVCGEVQGTIKATLESAKIELPNSYCNWMAIGNVVQSITLSIDHIDLQAQGFTGYYKISFYGTGNATGSGYYHAFITQNAS